MASNTRAADPTPAEIRRACRMIRKGWSADKERQRRAWSIIPAMAPIVERADALAELADAVEAECGPAAADV